MAKVVTIGSATLDVFVQCDDANIVSVCTKDHNSEFMSYPYGSKIDISEFSSNVGGGGINTATNLANLGFETYPVFKIGKEPYSNAILNHFKDRENIKLDYIIHDDATTTGFSVILVSFQGDRTVLTHRGGNAEIKYKEINLDLIKKADFIYVAPLNGLSNDVLEPLIKFAHKHDTKICFNAGTTSLKKGFKGIKTLLANANVVVLNKEEATLVTKIEVRPDTKSEKFSNELIHPDIKKMLQTLHVNKNQAIVITDGKKGAYAYCDDKYYQCPIFPSQVVSSLGAGDAFASTFCAAFTRTEDIGKCLMYGSVNSASVVSKFSATEGLLSFEEIEDILAKNPDYTYQMA